jgi:hypothetical protein
MSLTKSGNAEHVRGRGDCGTEVGPRVMAAILAVILFSVHSAELLASELWRQRRTNLVIYS